MIKIIILCIAGALFIGLVLFMILRILRARRNSPSEKENGLPPLLKEELEDAGFSYDRHPMSTAGSGKWATAVFMMRFHPASIWSCIANRLLFLIITNAG